MQPYAIDKQPTYSRLKVKNTGIICYMFKSLASL